VIEREREINREIVNEIKSGRERGELGGHTQIWRER